MTVPRLGEMTQYWAANPPVHLMIASYFGLSGNAKPMEKAKEQESSAADLLANIPMQVHEAPK